MTYLVFCTGVSTVLGTCPYGCRYAGSFGRIDPSVICNSEPPDGGCDRTCTDAVAGH